MVRRRGYLGYLASLIVGGAGVWFYTQNEQVKEQVDSVTRGAAPQVGPPPTENKISTQSFSELVDHFDKIEYYESGAANVWFHEGHGSDLRFGITHEYKDLDTESDAYRSWPTPDFAGPVTIDLQSVVRSHGPYPTQEFKMNIVAPDRTTLILWPAVRIQPPARYFGDATPTATATAEPTDGTNERRINVS